LGSRCLDWDSRTNLKKRDYIDCCDTYNIWYKGVVLDKNTEINPTTGELVPKIFIGKFILL